MGHPVLSLLESQWKLRQQHEQNLEGEPGHPTPLYPFCWEGGGGGVVPSTKFSKREALTQPSFLAGERVG